MKKINILTLGLALVATTVLTGCLHETFPQSSTATDEQIAESPSATANLAAGMPAATLKVWDSDNHYSFGLPANMVIRDMMTGDMHHNGELGYSWFTGWSENKYMGDGYLKTQFTWNFYYGFILSINQVVSAVDPDIATDEQKAYLGEAYAYRAMAYLDLARMYEFLPNDIYTSTNEQGMDVRNLTVPIVTDETTPEQAQNNPRATREEMKTFIENDLVNAEKYVKFRTDGSADRTQPDLACVYGLRARLAMWVEDYATAAEYAKKAIDNSPVKPIQQTEALSTTAGYNTASQFMWAMQQTQSSTCVTTAIINFISWMSNQTTFGYTGPATTLFVVMDKNLYNSISDTDWRKLEWVAPEGSALEGKNTYPACSQCELADYLPEYSSLKFRPGNGDTEDYNTGAATAIPIMRVEEMYYIWAEATVQTGGTLPTEFTSFMQSRDEKFVAATDKDELIRQIITNKRVELWGEGQTFFDIKRLNMSVTRGYAGTNCSDTNSRLNTNGRPAWMNFVMVRTESNNNKALEGMNNPDPSDKYTPWSE